MKFELKPYNRNVTDDELISDLRRVVTESGKETLSRIQYNKNGKYSEGTLRKRFGGWLNALEKAGLRKTRIYSTDNELISEIKRVAEFLAKKYISKDDYKNHSKISSTTTIERRFGAWNNALKKAGLEISPTGKRYSNEEYFENLLNVWTFYGRQPLIDELNKQPSKISGPSYGNRFGSWRKALESFVIKMNQDDSSGTQEIKLPILQINKAKARIIIPTEEKRGINLSLRYKVLSRDNFRCVRCGKSPATDIGVELHIDHKLPFSKGGKTILENLETKCKECNLGKSNRHIE